MGNVFRLVRHNSYVSFVTAFVNGMQLNVGDELNETIFQDENNNI